MKMPVNNSPTSPPQGQISTNLPPPQARIYQRGQRWRKAEHHNRWTSSGDTDTQTRTQTGEASDLSRLSCVCCTLPYPLVSLPSSAEVFLSALVFFSPSFLSGLSVFTAAFLGAIEKEREIKR